MDTKPKPKLSYIDLLNDFADLKILCNNLKKENKELKKMLKQWTAENNILQESLDGTTKEIERLFGVNKELEAFKQKVIDWENAQILTDEELSDAIKRG